jgi:galactose-1-phosphate uridylyltransferase
MTMTQPEQGVVFETRRCAARVLSPLAGYSEVESLSEYRLDPLTGRVAIVGLGLGGKRGALFAETDEAALQRLDDASRPGCFFCPGRVEQATPRFPADLLPGDGRLRRGGALLFPNLFPIADVHAVVSLGPRHLLRLDEFEPALLADGLAVSLELVRRLVAADAAPRCWAVCANYLPPGGASIVHPHLQALAASIPLTTQAIELERAAAYRRAHGRCYLDDLVAREEEVGERFVGRTGPVTWLTPFAPRGNVEVLGVCADAEKLTDLGDGHVRALAAGLSGVLRHYHGLRYSTFNLCIYSAPLDAERGTTRVYVSVVSRQSVADLYRCDDYFLQKMLGTEIVIDAPEAVAGALRQEFAGWRLDGA